jgi:hypothetical protein
MDDSEFLGDVEWQRIAEAMAEADDQPTSAFPDYVKRAKMIVAAVNVMLGILEEKMTSMKKKR